MKKLSTSILLLVGFTLLLSGCDTTTTQKTSTTKPEAEENSAPTETETKPESEIQTEEKDTSLDIEIPAEISEKGYTKLSASKENPSKTFVYEIYIDKDAFEGCSAGYMDFDAPIHCLLVIKDLKNDTIVKEYESDEYATFSVNGETFKQPSEWYDDNSLLIKWGMGDACVGYHTVNALNVFTGKLTLIVEDEIDCTPGILFTFPQKRLLFHFLGQMNTDPQVEKLEVYEVPDSIKSVADLYNEDPGTFDKTLNTAKVGKLINTLDDVHWADYETLTGVVAYDTISSEVRYLYDPDKNEFNPL